MLGRNSHSYHSKSADNYHANLSDSDSSDTTALSYDDKKKKKKATVTKKDTAARKHALKKINKISHCAKEQQYLASDSSDDEFTSK